MENIKKLKKELIGIALEKITKLDPSHDINHALRVLSISEKIAREEGADLNVLIPSALFHDVISYPKNHPKRLESSKESADFSTEVLNKIVFFPKDKISRVHDSIISCSFTKNLKPPSLEAQILQDADSLEATGTISIMRTFSSCGAMNKTFYNPEDPFCRKRNPDDSRYALDLFFTRLLIVQNRLHTKSAIKMSKKRVAFLKHFLNEFEKELLENENI